MASTSEDDLLQVLQQQINSLKEPRQQQLQLNADKAAREASLRNAAIKCAQGLVKLNVGGVKYTTSLSTLAAVPDSFFASLFSGDWQSAKTAEGDVFVDRDGEMFKHVLQYLRAVRDQQPFACAGSLTWDQLAAIAAEAHFYGLPDLEIATTEQIRKQEYEYKYLTTSSQGVYVYDPQVKVEQYAGQAIQSVVHWQPVGQSVRVQVPYTTPVGTKDLGEDPGSLLHLHHKGWEYVHSQADPSYGTDAILFVLRRRL